MTSLRAPDREEIARFLVTKPDDAGNSVGLLSVFEPEVQVRYRSMKQPQSRAAFLAARAQVRESVDEWLGDHVAEVHIRQHCDSCGSSGHGRPSLFDANGQRRGSVSWSRSGGHVGVALGEGTSEVAIDIESRDPTHMGLASQVLTLSEQDAVGAESDLEAAFLRLWTMKECAVKLGLCELDDFGGFDVELEFGRRGIVWWTGQDLDLVSTGALTTTNGSVWRRDASPSATGSPLVRNVVFHRVDPEEPTAPDLLPAGVGPGAQTRMVNR